MVAGAGSPDTGAHAATETYCFRVDAFVEPGFSVEDFVKECRLRVPMTELKADLGMPDLLSAFIIFITLQL